METRGALLWEPGRNSGWSVEGIQIDSPKEREVVVKLAASGVCHSVRGYPQAARLVAELTGGRTSIRRSPT